MKPNYRLIREIETEIYGEPITDWPEGTDLVDQLANPRLWGERENPPPMFMASQRPPVRCPHCRTLRQKKNHYEHAFDCPYNGVL